MCYSANGSLIIGLFGIFSSIYFFYKNKYASIGIGYFALMEILQYLQYQVIDQCNNSYNQFLTKIGYAHICFQPVFFNLWLFAFTKKPNFTFIYMSIFAGLLMLSRLFFLKENELCDENIEPLCGKKTCSITGKKHIVWNIRLRAAGQYWWSPSIALHFFMWFAPVLSLFELKPILVALLTGPYLAYFLIINDNMHKEGKEFALILSEAASIWCYTAIGQIFLTYLLLK